jgi:hypothetical protein
MRAFPRRESPAQPKRRAFESVSITAIVAIVISVGTFAHSVVKDWASALRDTKRPFFEKQLTLYFEAAEAATTLSNHDIDSDSWRKARTRFYELYWGPLGVVEDRRVSQAMVDFRSAFESDPRQQQSLRPLSLRLAHSLRASIEEHWGVSLGPTATAREDESRAAPTAGGQGGEGRAAGYDK